MVKNGNKPLTEVEKRLFLMNYKINLFNYRK